MMKQVSNGKSKETQSECGQPRIYCDPPAQPSPRLVVTDVG